MRFRGMTDKDYNIRNEGAFVIVVCESHDGDFIMLNPGEAGFLPQGEWSIASVMPTTYGTGETDHATGFPVIDSLTLGNCTMTAARMVGYVFGYHQIRLSTGILSDTATSNDWVGFNATVTSSGAGVVNVVLQPLLCATQCELRNIFMSSDIDVFAAGNAPVYSDMTIRRHHGTNGNYDDYSPCDITDFQVWNSSGQVRAVRCSGPIMATNEQYSPSIISVSGVAAAAGNVLNISYEARLVRPVGTGAYDDAFMAGGLDRIALAIFA